ncbi:Trk system potassium transporter TrkA [uncultured Cloacibacillus sp.]|uniref:Trk system potassium transporter TrkA n=1 Tax=uncultured Cloacibacillus sp. TaxID=889794 RepID=UPI0026231F88|nr:Trk system potassium transporter TrkA [uncultured Cloacibacillus sp.]
MRIVIVGAGEVGYSVARNLSADGHDIVIVEEDEERAAQAEETLDVMVVNGNGARPSVLAKAGITGKKSDVMMLIACTNRDEVNLMACWIAKRSGVPHVIARAVGLEFTDNESWANDLGIDMLVSPERSVAKDIEELLEVRAALHTTEIAGGRAGIYLFRVAQDSPLCGLPLYEIRKRNPKMIMLVVWVKSGEDSFVPKASYALQPGDLCYTMCYRSQILEIERLFQPAKSKRLKRVFIIGAGKIGHQTAERLLAHIRGIDLRIVDEDRAKCEKFAGELPRAMILCGNGADAEFLKSEGITDADGCVAATEHDETNLMLAVLAKTLGVSKSIAVVRNHNYLGMTNHIPVDAIVNRNQTLADVITRSVRYPGTSNVLTVLEEISAEAVETTVASGSAADGKKLMELTMPEGSLIGLLDRGGEMLIPTGQTELRGGDKIIIFGTAASMEAALAIFG